MFPSCLKINTIRYFIHLEYICPKFKVTILFFESKITTKFWFENCLAPERLQQLVKSDYILLKEQDEKVLYLFSFVTFDLRSLFVCHALLIQLGFWVKYQPQILFQILFGTRKAITIIIR